MKLTIQDDLGDVLNETAGKEYQRELGQATLTQIEGAVDDFRKSALADIEKEVSAAAQARLVEEQKKRGDQVQPDHPLVAITDGTQAIGARLLALFGLAITIILDWDHWGKKAREFINMIAKEYPTASLSPGVSLSTLVARPRPRRLSLFANPSQGQEGQEMSPYLEKHQTDIINDERRPPAGNPIGSGRLEKGVDQVIGRSQKKKGMSWSRKGSKALAILKRWR